MPAKPSRGGGTAPPKRGLLRRLFRVVVLLSGLLALVGIVDGVVTARAMQGRWQFQPPQLTDATVDMMMDNVERRVEETVAGRDQSGPGRGPLAKRTEERQQRIPDVLRKAVQRIGNTVLTAAASQVKLEVVNGGYRLEGAIGARAASSLIGARTGQSPNLSGCSSGTYLAAFPFLRATCGDGSGRSLWFLMRGWPGEELRLFPLPMGDDELHEKAKALMGDRERSAEQREAAAELVTLRFTREKT